MDSVTLDAARADARSPALATPTLPPREPIETAASKADAGALVTEQQQIDATAALAEAQSESLTLRDESEKVSVLSQYFARELMLMLPSCRRSFKNRRSSNKKMTAHLQLVS